MKTFSSVSALNDYLVEVINEVINDIAEEIETDLREKVREAYISTIGNKDDYFKYTPTYEFLNSITRPRAEVKNGEINIEIYFDPSKMTPKFREDEYWNAHMGMSGQEDDVWNGMSVPELLPFWIEYGTQNGMYRREEADSVGKVFRLYEQIFSQLIIKELKKRYGIKAN